MGSIYLLIFLMLCIGLAAWLFFLWAVKSGQYDDVEGPKYRMLDDDDTDEKTPGHDEPDTTTTERSDNHEHRVD